MKSGDKVTTIYNHTFLGKLIVEGKATLIKRLPEPYPDPVNREKWEVQFEGDDKNETYHRWVEPPRTK